MPGNPYLLAVVDTSRHDRVILQKENVGGLSLEWTARLNASSNVFLQLTDTSVMSVTFPVQALCQRPEVCPREQAQRIRRPIGRLASPSAIRVGWR